MYKVCIYNNETETLIHYPIPDNSAPHLKELPLDESLSEIYTLKFSIYPDSPGYDLLHELTTKIKVIDTRDDSIRFTGRISDITPNMDGMSVYKEVECESALTYLADTKMRNEALLGNLSTNLQTILTSHNSKVDDSRKIYLGTITATSSDAYQCDYKSCLETITDMKSKNNIDGDIRIREEDGILYLDWLTSFTSKVIELSLGTNIQKMVLDKNMDNFGTAIIPLGANNLDIKSVNGGLDYILDETAKNIYGYLEMTISYSDITDAQTLYNACLADIQAGKYIQPTLTLSTTALDLSYLTGEKTEEFELGATLHITNSLMGIDANYKIVKLSLNLLEPYNPNITISTNYKTSSDIINDTRNSSISNNSVHNGVQVGDDFGIRVSSSDGKIIITINALKGVSIEDVVNNIKKFFIDIDGNLTLDGIQQITKDGKLIIENTTNDNGGLNKIYDKDGNLNVKIGSENGTSDNVGGTIILYNDSEDKPRVELGISTEHDSGTINLKDNNGVRVAIYANSNLGAGIFILDISGSTKSYIREDQGKINNEIIATQNWVEQYVSDNMSSGGGTSGS